jgi:hypothetical protein
VLCGNNYHLPILGSVEHQRKALHACYNVGALLEMSWMVQHTAEIASAKKALSQLVFFKTGTEKSVQVLALKQLANEVGNKPGPVANGERTIINARADAWLAICRLTETIQQEPAAQSIDRLWMNALDAVNAWQRSCE